MPVKIISKEDFDKALGADNYFRGRWGHLKEVSDIVKRENPDTVLELGGYKLPITDGDTIGWDKEKMGIVKTTYNFDAMKTPWPVQKKYDMFIALQVWEHLGDKQKEAFQEVMRISKKAILSFPYLWGDEIGWMKKENIHYMIDKDKIAEWTLGIKPVWVKEVARRLIYFFDFEKEFKIVDFDDFSEKNNRLDLLIKLKEKIPNLKITLFVIPGKCSKEFCQKVNKEDWIELALHGDIHSYLECKNWTKEQTLKYLDKYEGWNCFQKIFRPPYWVGSEGLRQGLAEKGYILCQNKPMDYNGKLYILNKMGLNVSVHGHIPNVCGNGLEENFKHYSELSGNFKFISEIK